MERGDVARTTVQDALVPAAGEIAEPQVPECQPFAHEAIGRIFPTPRDAVPDSMILTLATRRLVDGFATTDTHPAVWFLVQLHIARGTLTWGDLETDSAFVLLAQANQPILATMAAINTWVLVHKGGVDPLALTAPAALRKRIDDFPTEPEIFLHDDAEIHEMELAWLAFEAEADPRARGQEETLASLLSPAQL
ncbi:hypothetical protein FNF29_00456 [Cafeteria roenbergensis]|nr:hypothetical protein FNF29_00456 [Cafeteria roenbergensis]|eukprot:KAA0157104.1 hypothetical protein FNF29_00456 [Cafeteria roenbergensis]